MSSSYTGSKFITNILNALNGKDSKICLMYSVNSQKWSSGDFIYFGLFTNAESSCLLYHL